MTRRIKDSRISFMALERILMPPGGTSRKKGERGVVVMVT